MTVVCLVLVELRSSSKTLERFFILIYCLNFILILAGVFF